jgi:hypothetical protein
MEKIIPQYHRIFQDYQRPKIAEYRECIKKERTVYIFPEYPALWAGSEPLLSKKLKAGVTGRFVLKSAGSEI